MIFKFNNTDKSWVTLDIGNFSVFSFAFIDDTDEIIYFDNLSFGISLTDKDNNTVERSFPNNGVSYLQTDQEILESFSIVEDNFYPGREQNIVLWCKNAGKKYEKSLKVNPSDYVEKIFPSWVWDEKLSMWEPPIGYPESDVFMKWDEETISWVEADELEVIDSDLI